jgi:hypothetical protein
VILPAETRRRLISALALIPVDRTGRDRVRNLPL